MGRPLVLVNTDHFKDARGPITGVRHPYVEAVERAGGIPVMLPHITQSAALGDLLGRVDAVMMIGGDDVLPHRTGEPLAAGCRPMSEARDTLDFALLEAALARRLPLLAICLGFQELNLHLGGTIWQDLEIRETPAAPSEHRHPETRLSIEHPVALEPGSPLAQLLPGEASLPVRSAHHQAIRDLAPPLRAMATSEDGLVEAAWLPGHPFAWGVMWHPEQSPEDPRQIKVFEQWLGSV